MVLEKIHQDVLDFLTGSPTPVKRHIIGNALFISDDMLRQVKRDLIALGHPIGSHHEHGYFLIRTDADLELALDEFKKKARTLTIRANQINKNFCKSIGRTPNEQLQLF